MTTVLHYFESGSRVTAVALPFVMDERLRDWDSLRKVMIKERPAGFSREEWGYLLQLVQADHLRSCFTQSFGTPVKKPRRPAQVLLRPRGPIALWLPNNVSLLGPLTLILLSLTGNSIRVKTGSRAEDLTGAFLSFCRKHLRQGALARYLREQVTAHSFMRDDPRNAVMSQDAAMRILFGSDAAAEAVFALPHALQVRDVAFSDRQSQAWIEPRLATDAVLLDLLKVFAVYGQAGCTSPQKVILLGADARKALAIRDRLAALWPKISPRDVPLDAASENLMVSQWAAMNGWDAVVAPRQGAVLAVGRFNSSPIQGRLTLTLIPATVEEAVAHLPANIQTVGHVLAKAHDPVWVKRLAPTPVKRFVPLREMHHFGPVWDGIAFWRDTFEEVGLQAGPAPR